MQRHHLEGGGGFQIMTIDDEGRGVFGPMMTPSQKSKFFGKFLGFHRVFH